MFGFLSSTPWIFFLWNLSIKLWGMFKENNYLNQDYHEFICSSQKWEYNFVGICNARDSHKDRKWGVIVSLL